MTPWPLALAAVEGEIASAGRGHDPEELLRLNALVERRAYLRGVHTWPMDLRAVLRVGFYLIIPPLAWIAAALVEQIVVGFLAGG